jgi:DNA repair exonuclease SbcCD ATPase subunit
MKIKTLKIENFLTITNAVVNLDDAGLVLVQGRNEADSSATSNGAGKSSIADALCWSLYDETARGESGDSVVNDAVGKNCRVSIEIEDSGVRYEISRHRKHKEHKNSTVVKQFPVSGGELVISKGTERETQELINVIMGCSYDVFKAAIYAGQETDVDIPAMTDRQLKLTIEEAAGIEDCEKAYALAKTMLNQKKSEVELRALKVTSTVEMIASDEARQAIAKAELADYESKRESLIATLEAERLAAHTELHARLKKIKAFPTDELNEKLRVVNESFEGHAHAKSAADGARYELQTFQNKTISTIKAQTKVQEDQISDLEKALISEDDLSLPCPACGAVSTPSAEAIAHRKAHKESALKNAVEKLTELNRRLKAAESEELSLKEKCEELQKKVPHVAELLTEKQEILNQLNSLKLEKASAATLHEKEKSLRERIDTIKTAPAPQKALIESYQKSIDECNERLKAFRVEGEKLEKELSVFESVVKVFGPAGVRAHILDTVTPFLNERTSDYLSVLSDGNLSAIWSTLSTNAKGEIREKFSIDVKNNEGGSTFKLVSGGEKRKVRIATMLALQDLVASRASKPIELWIGDEIDDALDPAGLERLMSILERKARERGTVLIISHNELKDWCDVTLNVVKKGKGDSTIVRE